MFYLRFESIWRLYFIVHITSSSELNNILLGGKYELVDLTFRLNRSTDEFDVPDNGTVTQFLRGTHIEWSYYEERGIHEILTENLMVQLIIIDVSSDVKDNSKYILSMEDLKSSLNKELLTQMSAWPSLMIIKFGWSKHYYEDSKNVGYIKGTDFYNTPAISSEVAEWLTNCELCKNVVGVGTDLPSLYAIRNNGTTTAARNILSKASLYIIEGLRLYDSLPVTDCVALLSPKKTHEATVPLTVLAICPKELYNANNAALDEQNRKKRAIGVIGNAVGAAVGNAVGAALANAVEHNMAEHHKHEHMGCGHHAHKHEDSTGMHNGVSTEENLDSKGGNDNAKQESLPQKIIGESLDKIKDKFNKILP